MFPLPIYYSFKLLQFTYLGVYYALQQFISAVCVFFR